MPFLSAVSAAFWPEGAFKKLGVIWSVFSVVSLARHAFDVGIGPTLQVMLSYYEAAIETALSPLRGLIYPAVIWFADAFGWRVDLQPYWTHLFVLLGLYMFSSVSVTWRIGRKTFAVFRFALAVPIAALCSVLAAAIPADDRIGTFVATSIPVLGLFGYNAASVLWRRIVPPPISKDPSGLGPREIEDGQEMLTALSGAKDLGSLLARHFVVFFMIGVAVLVLPVSDLEAAPVGVLAGLVGLSIIANLLLASSFSSRPRRAGDTWISVVQRTGSGLLAISMLSVVLWSGVFLACNAGLGLLGL